MQALTHVIHQQLAGLLGVIRRDENGQGVTEYALILVLIALVAIAATAFFGGKVSSALSTIASSV